LIGRVNDIEQTKESRAPQYQESGEDGKKKAHRSPSTQTDADRTGEGRRQGSKKEKAIAFQLWVQRSPPQWGQATAKKSSKNLSARN
jgi:hypothetical protein